MGYEVLGICQSCPNFAKDPDPYNFKHKIIFSNYFSLMLTENINPQRYIMHCIQQTDYTYQHFKNSFVLCECENCTTFSSHTYVTLHSVKIITYCINVWIFFFTVASFSRKFINAMMLYLSPAASQKRLSASA
jgi:hypothetical protein